MAKKKITEKDREKLFDRQISKGENSGHSLGQTIGHAFLNAGGYLTGQDVVLMANQGSFEYFGPVEPPGVRMFFWT